MCNRLVTPSERGVPPYELKVFLVKVTRQLSGVHAGMKTTPCDAEVHIWSRDCNLVVADFYPLTALRLENVYTHYSTHHTDLMTYKIIILITLIFPDPLRGHADQLFGQLLYTLFEIDIWDRNVAMEHLSGQRAPTISLK